MNINMLRDQDNDPGFYLAACGGDPGWKGAVIYTSIDNGATYQSLATITTGATIGVCSNALGNFAGGNIPDELNQLTVTLRNGELSSIPFASFLEGMQQAVIGDEIVWFRDAALNEDGTYTLSGFMRGRRGSEYAMGAHVVGERFVLLSPSAMHRVAATTADIGRTKLYKGVTAGRSITTAIAQEFTNEGAGLKPYAPVHLGGGWIGNDIVINWVRRTRISGEWRNSVDVPIGEGTEQYRIKIMNADRSAVIREITVSNAQATIYTEAMQTADFGAPVTTVRFSVAQYSDVVGFGYEAKGALIKQGASITD